MPEIKEHPDDHYLVTAFKDERSKDVAYTQLVRKYQERLYWHIRRMVVEHEDTNDILQNVFIKVWKNLAGFRNDAQLYTWMYRIATNECITFLNKKKQKKYSVIHSKQFYTQSPLNFLLFSPNMYICIYIYVCIYVCMYV